MCDFGHAYPAQSQTVVLVIRRKTNFMAMTRQECTTPFERVVGIVILSSLLRLSMAPRNAEFECRFQITEWQQHLLLCPQQIFGRL